MGVLINLYDERYRQNNYIDWSTNCDAPLSLGCTLREFESYYKRIYGKDNMAEFRERMARVKEQGSSLAYDTSHNDADSVILCNRAGRNERPLDKEGILNRFCRPRYRWRGKYERDVPGALKFKLKGLKVIWNKDH